MTELDLFDNPLSDLQKEKIPISCRICKYFLVDSDFIKTIGKPFACSFDGELNPDLSEFCDQLKIGEWNLVEFLHEILKKITSRKRK